MRRVSTNIDAERFVLGAILLDAERFVEAAALQPDDFSLERHRQIFARMCDLHECEEHIDRVTVAEELARRGQLGTDGLSYLLSLDDGMPQLPHIDSYVRIVREKSTLRRTILAAQKLMNEAVLETAPVAEILEGHRMLMDEIGRSGTRTTAIRSVTDLPAVAEDDNAHIVYVREPELVKGSVTTFTGDSGSGKSTLAAAMGRDGRSAGIPLLILDKENPRDAVVERNQRLKLQDGQGYSHWGGWCNEEAPQPDSPVILDWVRSCETKPLVVVDSLAAFHGGDQNDAGMMRAFMHRCRRLADLGATVLIIHHDGKAETAKDYRGSSDFKAAVDQAFHVSNFGDGGRLNKLVLRCFKSRFGFAGEITYHYANGLFIRSDAGESAQTVSEQLTVLLRINPGVNGTHFEELAAKRNISRSQVRTFLNDGLSARSIKCETGTKNTRRYFLAGKEAQHEF